MTDIPRNEYPRPQFVRRDWLCLNGEWQFEIDPGDSGLERGLVERELAGTIVVPFCPESELSGIGNADFMNAVWYRRTVESLPTGPGGACCCTSRRWTTTRRSGSTARGRPASRRLLAVHSATCRRSSGRPRPSRSSCAPATGTRRGPSHAASRRDEYGPARLRSTRARPASGRRSGWSRCRRSLWSARASRRTSPTALSALEQPISNNRPGLRLRATLSDADGDVVSARSVGGCRPRAAAWTWRFRTDRRRLWSIGDPHLYDLRIELLDADGTVVDRAGSYAGLRSVAIDGKAVKINGEAVFQRLVLDQGYYPDGIMTAPSDEALVRDIELSHGGRVQRRAAAPEGLRGALPLPRRPAGLPRLGRVRRLGLWTDGAAERRASEAGRRTTSRSGWKCWRATTLTRASSAGAR